MWVVRLLAALALVLTAVSGAVAHAAPVALTSRATSDPQAQAAVHADYGLLARSFPSLAAAPSDLSATATAPAGSRVDAYLADNVARIDGPDGHHVVVASRPLRVRDVHGRSLPVDLELQQQADGTLAPHTAPFALSIADDPAAGFSLGPDPAHSVHVTPLSDAPNTAATLQGNEVFAAETHTRSDTLLRPTSTGLETDEQLRGPGSPSVFAWRLDLTPNQRVSLRQGSVVVTQDGTPVLSVPTPVAYDANHRLLPSTTALVENVLSVRLSLAPDVAYPVIVDPTWQSFYLWSFVHFDFGTEGWAPDANPDPFYQAFVLTGPQTVNGQTLNPGFTIQPVKGTNHLFSSDEGVQFTWQSPGTTRIRSARFSDVHEVNDRVRQTSRLALYGGVEQVDDWFRTDVVRDVPVVELDDPAALARYAIVRMFTPPCSIGGVPPNDCRTIPSTSLAIQQVGSVDFTLDDNDLPTARGSGPVRDLAGTWSAPTGTQQLVGDFEDDGVGVASTALTVTGTSSAAPLLQDPVTTCDALHNHLGQGSNICPAHIQQPFSVDVGGLPEGKVHFALGASDFAGNASDATTADSWDAYIDRTAPSTAASGPLRAAAGTWVDPHDVAGGVHVHGHDALSGVASLSLDATDEAGATVIHVAHSTCPTLSSTDGSCNSDTATDVALDADALPEGRLDVSATARDLVGNVSTPESWHVYLDRTSPAARAEGDLLGLQGQWTNRTTPIDVTLTGRDAGSGIEQLRLVAVNAEGRTVIGQADTCEAAEQDPSDNSCPHVISRTVAVDPSQLADGKSTFEAEAVDRAGHVSRADQSWDTYLDHTPPPAPSGLTVKSSSVDTASISWNRVSDQPNSAPVVDYQYLVKAGKQTIVNWTTTPYPAAVVPGIPPGTDVEVLVRAQDASGNLSYPAEDDEQFPLFIPSGSHGSLSASAASSELSFVRRFAPYVVSDNVDGFYPVKFDWVFALRQPYTDKPPCIHNSDKCLYTAEKPLPATKGSGQYIEYPAKNDIGPQLHLINDAIVAWRAKHNYAPAQGDPQQSVPYGYYVVSDPLRDGSFVVQYWYFWTFNYFWVYDIKDQLWPADYHEGDLEHVDIYFDRHDTPLAITESRHASDQYKTYLWGDPRIGRSGRHPWVFAADGSHALYERCNPGGFQLHSVESPLPAGWIPARDVTCAAGENNAITAATPNDVVRGLNSDIDAWACWRGKVGNKGPLAPLRQSSAPGVESRCLTAGSARVKHAAAPGAVPGRECKSYESSPDETGMVAVACDQAELDRVAAGDKVDAMSWHTVAGASVRSADGQPAVVASDDPATLAGLQLRSAGATHPDIYLASRAGRVISQAHFPALALAAGESLRVKISATGPWKLTDAHGTVLASVTPRREILPATPKLPVGGPRAPRPTHLRVRRGRHTSVVSWRAAGHARPRTAFYVLSARTRHTPSTVLLVMAQHRRHRFSVRLSNRKLLGRYVHVLAVLGRSSRSSATIHVPHPHRAHP
jgi:hypothetical protein